MEDMKPKYLPSQMSESKNKNETVMTEIRFTEPNSP